MSVRFSARVTTANIQNFPDMTPHQVDADHLDVLGHSDLVLWQETGERADFDSILNMAKHFPNKHFRTTKYENECPITYNSEIFRQARPSESIRMTPGLGPGSKSPARYLTKLILTSVKYPTFPHIEVHNVHYIQNAWNSKAVSDKHERKRQWDTEWKRQRDLVLHALSLKRIVIFGGDWNRNADDIEPFTADQKWLVGKHAGLDHIGVCTPPGMKVECKNSFILDLHSDHNAKGAEFIFVGPRK